MLKYKFVNVIKTTSLLGMSIFLSSNLQASYLKNFNEPNTSQLTNAISSKQLHVVQLGDSHTAADEMTDALRSQLQSALGNGGLGWGMPMYFSGQRMALYGYDKSGWLPISSRSQRDHSYTLGGLIATPQHDGATLTIKPKRFAPQQDFIVSIRQGTHDGYFAGVDANGQHFKLEAPQKNNQWQMVKFNAQLPFTITAKNSIHSAIGGWWGKNQHSQGAIVSAMGINGAELSFWNRWNNDAIHQEIASVAPELIILAYGTNEAFNDNLDIEHTRQLLTQKIRQIRQASPKTAVMIVAAPETLKSTAGECGSRPIKLQAVQQMQLQVAQSEHTLYWDWQAAMGGSCSMKSWISNGLASRDGVHFSATGYQRLGRTLANDILDISDLSFAPTQDQNQTQANATSFQLAKPVGSGYAEICLEGNTECKRYNF